MAKTVVLIGTLDTKGIEFGYVKERIIEHGCRVLVVDAGIVGKPLLEPDITREQVAQAAGSTIEDIIALGNEGKAIEMMSYGATAIVQELYHSGRLDGIFSLGGTMGTFLATAAMRALPLGVPKVVVSTMAAADTSSYLGTKDVILIPAITDIVGLNRIMKRMLTTAAGAIVGMVNADPGSLPAEKPLIAVTTHGDLIPCVNYATTLLEKKGYEVVVFHAVGAGGKTFEEWIEQGQIAGTVDLCTHEVMSHLFGVGGLCDAGPARLESAGKKGIPQVVAPGKSDAIAFIMTQGMPEHFKGRELWVHNPFNAGVRANKEEMATFGNVMAEKLNRANGPTAAIIPLKGFSSLDKEGNTWYDPEANAAFIEALKKNVRSQIDIVEVDAHINDKLFAETAANLLDELMHRTG